MFIFTFSQSNQSRKNKGHPFWFHQPWENCNPADPQQGKTAVLVLVGCRVKPAEIPLLLVGCQLDSAIMLMGVHAEVILGFTPVLPGEQSL